MEEVGTTGGRKIIWLSYSMMKDWGRRDITGLLFSVMEETDFLLS